MSDWQVSVSSSKGQAPQAVAASYTATISLELENSNFRLNNDLPRRSLFNAISRPPEWVTTSPWTPPQDSSDRELTRSALSKLLALLEFASQIDATTADGVQRMMDDLYPNMVQERLLKKKGALTQKYKVFEVWAEILEDGSPTWGFDVPTAGKMLPGILQGNEEQAVTQILAPSNAPGLDLFLQNSARTDLIKRLVPS